MKKGIEIIKEIFFSNCKETAELYNMEYSTQYSYMRVTIDYDKRELMTYLHSTWNSSYDRNEIVKF